MGDRRRLPGYSVLPNGLRRLRLPGHRLQDDQETTARSAQHAAQISVAVDWAEVAMGARQLPSLPSDDETLL